MKKVLPWWPGFAALLITLAALAAGHARALPTSGLLGAALGIFLLLCGYFALSDAGVQSRLALWCANSRARVCILACSLALPYLAYAAPLHGLSAKGLVALLLYAILPALTLQASHSKGDSPFADFAALLFIWLPLEFGVLPPLWLWPPGQSGHYLDGLLGVLVAVTCFQVVRALPGIGYHLVPRGRDWMLAAAGCCLFLPLALALAAWTGFLHFSPHDPKLPVIAARILGTFLVTAVPEELLFRGLLQNLLQRWTARPGLALGVSAIVFGMAHLNVGAHPDWRLVLLATLAGLLYGWLFRASGGLMAPALAHTFVDSLWLLLFRH
jgi:membrane protease YdiL (CAAX protease family)